MVLVKFANDTMVEPVESEWFGFYKPGQADEVQSLQNSELYQQVSSRAIDLEICDMLFCHWQDRLGLRAMDMSGKIHYLSLPTEHLQFTDVWFIENIIKKFLL